jgi:hypothetical protein
VALYLPIANKIPSSITIGGKTHSLEHLKSADVVLAAEGRNKKNVIVKVTVTSHSYSRTPLEDEIYDFRDENDKPRVFCEDRYKASINLISYCSDSIQRNSLTWESKDRNNKSCFMMVEIDDGKYYGIFYRLVPSYSAKYDVEFIIKSAYLVTNLRSNPRRFNIKSLIKKCYYESKSLP